MCTNPACAEVALCQTPPEVSNACDFVDKRKQIPNDWQTIMEKYLPRPASIRDKTADDRLLAEEHRRALLAAARRQGCLTFAIG